jgi:hypothetical protein
LSPSIRFLKKSLCLAAAVVAVSFPRLPGQTAEGPRRPHFTDTVPRCRFTYVTNNNFTGRKYFQQSMCGGVAAFDYDNDGRMDIFFTTACCTIKGTAISRM